MPIPPASAAVIAIEPARAAAASMPENLIDRFKVLSPVELLESCCRECSAAMPVFHLPWQIVHLICRHRKSSMRMWNSRIRYHYPRIDGGLTSQYDRALNLYTPEDAREACVQPA
jgi:hypothetical protein